MPKLLPALIATTLFALPGISQSKLSKKEIKARLIANSWIVVRTWNGTQEDVDLPFEWNETPVQDSRHAEYFGAEKIMLKADGTFSAVRFTGESLFGKWSTKHGLKFTYKDQNGFDWENEFDTIQFTSSGFIASGDICQDGCFAKTEFEKAK